MKKISSRWSSITSKSLKYWIILLCKIFVIGLLLQFFLQTFVTFELGWDGKFWTLFWMWKEFILLIFVVILLWYIFANLKGWIENIKNRENIENVTWKILLKNIQSKFIVQFIFVFLVSIIIFFLLAVLFQHVGIKAFIMSAKYDLIGFFIFGIGVCLSLLFFVEDDEDLLKLYNKLIVWSLRLGLFWWFIIRLMPNILKYVGYNPNIYEGTVGQNPPAAYYTKIVPFYEGSYVRNSFLFERPISFGFWLIAFFPIFVLCFLRNKSWRKQILPVIAFGLLILSTWSRAGIAVWALEVVILFFVLYRKAVKKYFVRLVILAILGLCGLAYLSRGIMVREHSNTGHLELMKSGWNIAKDNLFFGRGAGYSGPASHQLCYTDNPVDIFEDVDSIHMEDQRCEIIRKENVRNQISTYGFNPENQYLQILMEYGVVGILFWLLLCLTILGYSAKMIWKYCNKTKSPYQEMIYYSLLGFGIGFLGLLFEGIVLHSLVDRMIIYPFFLLYGISVGQWEKIKDYQYVPVISKKKKKKKKKK